MDRLARASSEAWWRVVEDNRRMRYWDLCPNVAALPYVSPYNTVSDLRPQSPSSCLAFRTTSERDIEAGGLAVGWEKGRIRKPPLSRIMYIKGGRKATYTISPRGRPQYRRQGPPSFQGDVVSWGYSSRVDFAASSRMKTRTSSLKEIRRS